MKNLHACLVHESRDCVIDLVRNLHHLDPASKILLYNGGQDPALLRADFPWERYNAVVHPSPRPMKWGWLHDFALDCMRFGFEQGGFDTMTIVDSDQLGLRPGYSEFIADWLAGKSKVGMLGSVAGGGGHGKSPPAVQALKELDLWRRFLRRFERGEQKFVHWTFWPSTVFTAEAARALLELWPDAELQAILQRTKIWASEEVILPTLVALLGYSIEQNPCRHDFVRYRVRYSPAQLDAAMANPAVFWAHPVPRRYDETLRAHVRKRLAGYDGSEGGSAVAPIADGQGPGLLMTLPILNEVRAIEGWLSDEEADLLIACAAHALKEAPGEGRIVEVGSYCGKATVALGRVVQALAPQTRICAIDPHDGLVGSRDGNLQRCAPTREKFRRNLERAGVAEQVDVYEARACDVALDGEIRLLLVDGLHDYASVAADFRHFEAQVGERGLVAFHDYADYYPGVKLFVDELLRSQVWAKVRSAGSLMVLRRVPRACLEAPAVAGTSMSVFEAASAEMREEVPRKLGGRPVRVSCIMPTADRRALIPQAIKLFQRQTYEACELVIVDDGRDPVADLVPADPRIRYIRLRERRTVGEKRNLACAEARGELIAHFDDDDWSAPERLALQVGELERAGAALAGLERVYYLDPGAGRSWEYRFPGGRRRWLAGNSLLYEKAAWARVPFQQIDVGEDARFVWAHAGARLVTHSDSSFLVAMIHGSNVSKKQVHQGCWHPTPSEVVGSIMGSDFELYRDLFLGEIAARAAG